MQVLNLYHLLVQDAMQTVQDVPKHGYFVSSCQQHCQTSDAWNAVKIGGHSLREVFVAWYFGMDGGKAMDDSWTTASTC